MGKRYAILGGGGSFGIHSALYLLDHADPELVMGIGRNLMRPEPFSLNIEKRRATNITPITSPMNSTSCSNCSIARSRK